MSAADDQNTANGIQQLMSQLIANSNITTAAAALREAVEAAIKEAVEATNQEATFADDNLVESSLPADANASPITTVAASAVTAEHGDATSTTADCWVPATSAGIAAPCAALSTGICAQGHARTIAAFDTTSVD